jgi:transcription elongation factor Elf1
MNTLKKPKDLPCPFCGSKKLDTTEWFDEDGEFEAIECLNCKGAAPARIWNLREWKPDQ